MDDIRLKLDCNVYHEKDLYTLSISKTATHQECTVTLVSQINYFDRIDPSKHIIQWHKITKISFVKVSESPETFGLRLFYYNDSDGKETKVQNDLNDFKKSYFLYNSKTQPTVGRLEIQAQEIRDSIDFDEWKQFGWICTETADSIVFESTNKHAQKPSKEGNKQPENTDKKHAETTKKTWTLETLLKLPELWTFYNVLDVQPNFTNRELEHNYKKKCLKWHPDRGRLSSKAEDGVGVSEYGEWIFKLLGEAFNTLKDRDLKDDHDREIMDGGKWAVKMKDGKKFHYRERYSWILKWDFKNKDAGTVVEKFYNRYFIEL